MANKQHKWRFKIFSCNKSSGQVYDSDFDFAPDPLNAWLLYRKECSFFQVPEKHQLEFLNFTSEVSFSLVHKNKAILPSKKRKRPTTYQRKYLTVPV